jgi:hypothetical protein
VLLGAALPERQANFVCGAEGLPMIGDDFGAVVLAVEAFMEEGAA